jgi:SAM-dependent methyltransferase
VIHDGRDSPAYWETRAQPYLGGEEEWRAVSIEGSPAIAKWHRLFEERGVRILEHHLPREGRVLDAGCGVGRWFKLIAPGRSLTGMDFSQALLERAAANDHGVDVILGDVRDIPVESESFDAAFTVKVLQCLKREERPEAVAELFRVTAPGGTVVLFEKTRGADGSASSDWLRWGQLADARLVVWYPNGYALLDRAVAALVALIQRCVGDDEAAPSTHAAVGRSGLAQRRPGVYSAYMRTRALALAASFPVELLAERLFPRTWADHAIFVFRR